MVVTVTLNPALDKTAELVELQVGELNRLQQIRTDIGGKGINVSKMIASLGGSTLATGFVGGGSGEEIVQTLEIMEIPADFVKVQGVTRTNLKVLDQESRLTELNEPGVKVTGKEVEELLQGIGKYIAKDTIFVLSGSLCQGVDIEFYARLVHIIHKQEGRVFLDVDGEAFHAAVKEKPDFVKPNKHELLEFFGINEELTISELQELCRQLMGYGIPRMALSMGAEGALFFDGYVCTKGVGLKVTAHSSVGAGDCMMGAFAYAADQKMSWEDSTRLALASSAGAVTTIGTKAPSRELVESLLAQVEMQYL